MVDAHEHGDAAHHARPLPLELVGFPQVAVDAGVQQADDSWNTQHTTTERQVTPHTGFGSLSLLRK